MVGASPPPYLPDVYPATDAVKAYRSTPVASIVPLWCGMKKLSNASANSDDVSASIYVPTPKMAAKRPVLPGNRNTSPWMYFHPDSSWSSPSSVSAVNRTKSFLSTLRRMVARKTSSKIIVTTELMMENHWTCWGRAMLYVLCVNANVPGQMAVLWRAKQRW